MKKKLFPIAAILLLLLAGSDLTAQQNWLTLKKPFNASFASSNQRFAQDIVPKIPITQNWKTTAWRGETIHAQILIWTSQDISTLSVSHSSLINKTGDKIGHENISTGFLRYVWTDEFGKGCGYHTSTEYDSSLVADPVDTARTTPVKKNTVQPVWLSIQVPANTPAGEYTGSIQVITGTNSTLNIQLKVQDHILPPANEWRFKLDLWQHPAAIARVHNVPLWSEAHFAAMRKYYEQLAGAGQKYITTTLIDEPWNHQTYDDFPSLVKWIKKPDGSWTFDYSLFDRYVEFVMSCGINKGINCYSMVPWKLSFAYYDEALRKDTALVAAIGSPEYNAHWSRMLVDFTAHLKSKGWFEISRIAMDERPMESMKAVIALIKTIDPAWKLALAGELHPEIEADIYDYCVASKFLFPAAMLQARSAAGKSSTFYTCCVEKLPNGFSFSPPAESAFMGWYAAAQGFEGYLRWAYNSWVSNPFKDTRFTAWPGGDTYQVYPGPMRSIRFDKLVEGIQAYEKIRILREEFTRNKNEKALKSLNEALSNFSIETLEKSSAASMVEKAAKVIDGF